eukprot:598131-Pelagomonas_calceolata.AAC.3
MYTYPAYYWNCWSMLASSLDGQGVSVRIGASDYLSETRVFLHYACSQKGFSSCDVPVASRKLIGMQLLQ